MKFDYDAYVAARAKRIRKLVACAAATRDVEAAKERQLRVMKAMLPLTAKVRVHHYRGSFLAIIVGHQDYSNHGYLIVRNQITDKTSKRYFHDLELV